MSKIDFKKEYKELYKPSVKKVSIVEITKFNYLSIDGVGDPNTSIEYKQAIEALFSVSYKVKFMIKKGSIGIDYGVLPLEGLWWTEDMNDFSIERKDLWNWTAMIMQPDFVEKELVDEAMKEVNKKKELPAISKIKFQIIEEGLAAQIMHIGPYSEEKPTIEKLHNYIKDNGYVFNGKHHEIYLSDVRKAAPQNLKTIIRQPISSIE
ncbi:GyrI-like domain-containing protein [Abyssisolibacter fermentans]|uniref:GyrI-like domain-containing protein n=1 Tax=Abyssisolibacter fermentans TaxID=1766203 RepID=UPI0008336B5C|nr:GyrI-like domain-containing protein [Abyssisolibacter fermentans]